MLAEQRSIFVPIYLRHCAAGQFEVINVREISS